MPDLLKFYPLVKIDETTHTVTGMATAELPDLDGEIAVYADTKPQYMEWSAAAAASTKAAGQEISLGNIRIQHGMDVGGKVVAINYNDADKQIFIETRPVDDAMWEKLKKGFFRGFSHAGSYLYRKCAQCNADMLMSGGHYCLKCKSQVDVKYAPKLAEISYVDSPCLAEATFTAVKADGSTEMRKFAPQETPVSKRKLEILFEDDLVIVRKHHPDERVTVFHKPQPVTKSVGGENLPASAFLLAGPDSSKWQFPINTKNNIRKAIAGFGRLAISDEDKSHAWRALKAAAESNGIDIDAAQQKQPVAKGMYQISALADMLSQIRWLMQACIDEGIWEEDPRDGEIADDIRDWLIQGVEILKDIVEEETDELTATAAKGAGSMAETNKARKTSLAAHFKKTASHHEKMAAAHGDAQKMHSDMADVHKSAMGKAEDGGDHKALAAFHEKKAAFHEKCAKAHEAQADHCTSMADSQEEEGEKAVKTATAPVVVPAQAAAAVTDPAAPVVVEKTAAVAEDPNDPQVVMKSMINSTVVEMMKEALNSFKGSPDANRLMTDSITGMFKAKLDNTIVPDGVRVATPGLTIVPRPGEVQKSAPVANEDSLAVGF